MLILFILGFFFLHIQNILLPFIFSLILAYILNPLVSYFESKGIKRIFVVFGLYIVAIFIIIILIDFFVPIIIREITRLKNNLPYYVNQTKYYINMLNVYVARVPFLKKLQGMDIITQNIYPKIMSTFSMYASSMPKRILNVASVASLMLLIPFITFFTLIGGKKIIRSLFDFIPSSYVETTLSLICEIDAVLGKYIRGQIMDATIVGILATMGLSIIDVDHALLFGILAGIGNLVPYLGPIVGGVPAAIVVLLKTKSLMPVLEVVIVFMSVQFLDNNFIAPFVVGKTVKLHPVAILFALLVGSQLFGPIGLLFAVPSFCVFKITFSVLFKHFFKNQPRNITTEEHTIV